VHFRLKEVEFPPASQSVCKLLFEGTLGGSHAVDRASIDALRLFNNWVNLKDQHELLFIRETLAPRARWVPTQRQWPLALSTRGSENSKEDILAADRGIFWKRENRKERSNGSSAQWRAALATVAET
jgi:hypothetical protein